MAFYLIGLLDVGVNGLSGYMFLSSRRGKKYLFVTQVPDYPFDQLDPRIDTACYLLEFKFVYSILQGERRHAFITGIRYQHVTT